MISLSEIFNSLQRSCWKISHILFCDVSSGDTTQPNPAVLAITSQGHGGSTIISEYYKMTLKLIIKTNYKIRVTALLGLYMEHIYIKL